MTTPEPLHLADLGERELLQRLLPLLAAAEVGPDDAAYLGPGDDAAVLPTSGSVVVTTDSMVRGRDWRDDWSTGADVGRKAVAQNVADVAAMGARPTGLLLALAADPQTPLAWVEDLARGVAEAAQDAGCPVAGGDLSSAPEGVVVVAVTALGDLEGRHPVRRDGARVGDVVAVCGSLGWSGAGLSLYAGGEAAPRLTPGVSARDKDVATLMWFHRSPRPPWEAGPVAARAGAHALIDISDGLVRDAGRVAEASGVTVALEQAGLAPFVEDAPMTVLAPEEALVQVLSGGEEHSLLGCFAPGDVPDDPQAPWHVIGTVVAAGEHPVTLDGEPPQVLGWDHFRG